MAEKPSDKKTWSADTYARADEPIIVAYRGGILSGVGNHDGAIHREHVCMRCIGSTLKPRRALERAGGRFFDGRNERLGNSGSHGRSICLLNASSARVCVRRNHSHETPRVPCRSGACSRASRLRPGHGRDQIQRRASIDRRDPSYRVASFRGSHIGSCRSAGEVGLICVRILGDG